MSYIHVVKNASYTVREGQKNAGIESSIPGLTVSLVAHDRASLKGSLEKFSNDSAGYAAAQEYALALMQDAYLAICDAKLAIRQTRRHNLNAGSTPGITKDGFMTKTEDAKNASAARAAKNAAAKKTKTSKKTSTRKTSKKTA